MCSTDNKTLLIYTSNDNQTYVGNIFRVLSLPQGYVISFPYQWKYLDQSLSGYSSKHRKKNPIPNKEDVEKSSEELEKYKEKKVIIFASLEKKQMLNDYDYFDIPIRRAILKDVRWQEQSGSYILDLELQDFVILNEPFPKKSKTKTKCINRQKQWKRYPDFVCTQLDQNRIKVKNITDLINDNTDWHRVIENIAPFLPETAVFYLIEKISLKENLFAKVLSNVCIFCIFILLVLGYFIIHSISINLIFITILSIIIISGFISYNSFIPNCWLCLEKIKSFFYQNNGPDKIKPKSEHPQTRQTLFELKENSNYFVTLHTHFNKNHPDYKKGQNYFIYPTQTDSILSGNIEERIYVNNTYMSLDIPFETNYLDIHQDASYLIFRIHKTLNPQRKKIGLPPTIKQGTYLDTEALYHLDAPIRVRVVKPWYKVPLVAGILTLLKVMLTPVFKGKEFHWDTFKNNFWECCDIEKGIAQSIGCHWDDVVVTFIAFTIILTLIHYIFKSFTPGHSRIHHQ